jgi:hypothetical protein
LETLPFVRDEIVQSNDGYSDGILCQVSVETDSLIQVLPFELQMGL